MNTLKSKCAAGFSILAGMFLSTNLSAMERDPICPDPTELCNGDPDNPPPPPPRPPDTRRFIHYPNYTDNNTVVVSWSGRHIFEGRLIFELEESTNGGGWMQVYEGVRPDVTLTNKPQGTLAYRVRACDGLRPWLCSGYLTGKTMVVNPRPVVNLYEKYPILHTLDQRTANYRATVPSLLTDLPRFVVPGQTITRDNARIDGPRFILGDGYDVVSSGLKEICLDVQHPTIRIDKSAPTRPSTYDVIQIRDNRHLAETLNISEGAKGGITHEDFTLGVSLEAERFRKAVTDDTYARVVVRWIQRGERWQLVTPVDPLTPEIVDRFFDPNIPSKKEEFRERCGDQFISQAHVGASLYLIFTYDLKKYSVEERSSKKHTLGLKIGEIFNISPNASVSAEAKAYFEAERIQVHAEQVGGPPGLAASITPNNFAEKFNEFVQGTNSSNWAAVDFTTANYEVPSAYSAYPRSQMFADYEAPQIQMRRWATIVVQHRERCMPYADHGRTAPPECDAAEAELGTPLDDCRVTSRWQHCVHPGAYRVRLGVNPVGTLLLGWLNEHVTKLEDRNVSQSWAHHVHRGNKFVNDDTCLPQECFVNIFQGANEGVGRGFMPTVYERDNPKHPNTQPTFTLVDDSRCVNTQLYLETHEPFIIGGDSTADFNYEMRVIGFCPVFSPFVTIP